MNPIFNAVGFINEEDDRETDAWKQLLIFTMQSFQSSLLPLE